MQHEYIQSPQFAPHRAPAARGALACLRHRRPLLHAFNARRNVRCLFDFPRPVASVAPLSIVKNQEDSCPSKVSLKVSHHHDPPSRARPPPHPPTPTSRLHFIALGDNSHAFARSIFTLCYLHNPLKIQVGTLWRVGLDVCNSLLFQLVDQGPQEWLLHKDNQKYGWVRMRLCRETLGISHYGRFGHATITRAHLKGIAPHQILSLPLVPFIVHIAFLQTCEMIKSLCFISTLVKLAFKVQISKIWIFSYCYRFINRLIKTINNIKRCTLSVQEMKFKLLLIVTREHNYTQNCANITMSGAQCGSRRALNSLVVPMQ